MPAARRRARATSPASISLWLNTATHHLGLPHGSFAARPPPARSEGESRGGAARRWAQDPRHTPRLQGGAGVTASHLPSWPGYGGARAWPCPGGVPCHPCLSFPSRGNSSVSQRRSQPQFGGAWLRGRAPAASPLWWQQVTMLVSPPWVYSSSFWGCPHGRRPHVGSPCRERVLMEGSAMSAPCQAVARCPQCPHVLQGCPQACASPPSRRTLSPWAFSGPPCPHRSCSSLTLPRASACPGPPGCHPWVPGLAQGFVLRLCPGPRVRPEQSVSPELGGTVWGVFAPSC